MIWHPTPTKSRHHQLVKSRHHVLQCFPKDGFYCENWFYFATRGTVTDAGIDTRYPPAVNYVWHSPSNAIADVAGFDWADMLGYPENIGLSYTDWNNPAIAHRIDTPSDYSAYFGVTVPNDGAMRIPNYAAMTADAGKFSDQLSGYWSGIFGGIGPELYSFFLFRPYWFFHGYINQIPSHDGWQNVQCANRAKYRISKNMPVWEGVADIITDTPSWDPLSNPKISIANVSLTDHFTAESCPRPRYFSSPTPGDPNAGPWYEVPMPAASGSQGDAESGLVGRVCFHIIGESVEHFQSRTGLTVT